MTIATVPNSRTVLTGHFCNPQTQEVQIIKHLRLGAKRYTRSIYGEFEKKSATSFSSRSSNGVKADDEAVDKVRFNIETGERQKELMSMITLTSAMFIKGMRGYGCDLN